MNKSYVTVAIIAIIVAGIIFASGLLLGVFIGAKVQYQTLKYDDQLMDTVGIRYVLGNQLTEIDNKLNVKIDENNRAISDKLNKIIDRTVFVNYDFDTGTGDVDVEISGNGWGNNFAGGWRCLGHNMTPIQAIDYIQAYQSTEKNIEKVSVSLHDNDFPDGYMYPFTKVSDAVNYLRILEKRRH